MTDHAAALARWKAEGMDAFEARASLFARYHRSQDDAECDAILELDSEWFDVTTDDELPLQVQWRAEG